VCGWKFVIIGLYFDDGVTRNEIDLQVVKIDRANGLFRHRTKGNMVVVARVIIKVYFIFRVGRGDGNQLKRRKSIFGLVIVCSHFHGIA